MGSCHSKWGVERPEKSAELRSEILRPRGRLYVAWVYDEAEPARNPGGGLESSKEFAVRRWLICKAKGPFVGLLSPRRLTILDELIGREKLRADPDWPGEPRERLEGVRP